MPDIDITILPAALAARSQYGGSCTAWRNTGTRDTKPSPPPTISLVRSRVNARVLKGLWRGRAAPQSGSRSYSTMQGREGLFPGDMYLEEAHRSRGFGRALLAELSRIGGTLNRCITVASEPRRMENEVLVRDLLDWIAVQPPTYTDVLAVWRTSCPRRTIWEDTVDAGLVRPHGPMVEVRPRERAFLSACQRRARRLLAGTCS